MNRDTHHDAQHKEYWNIIRDHGLHGESKFEEEHCLDLAVQVYLNELFPNSSGNMLTKDWSEPAATTAPVQDEVGDEPK